VDDVGQAAVEVPLAEIQRLLAEIEEIGLREVLLEIVD